MNQELKSKILHYLKIIFLIDGGDALRDIFDDVDDLSNVDIEYVFSIARLEYPSLPFLDYFINKNRVDVILFILKIMLSVHDDYDMDDNQCIELEGLIFDLELHTLSNH